MYNHRAIGLSPLIKPSPLRQALLHESFVIQVFESSILTTSTSADPLQLVWSLLAESFDTDPYTPFRPHARGAEGEKTRPQATLPTPSLWYIVTTHPDRGANGPR